MPLQFARFALILVIICPAVAPAADKPPVLIPGRVVDAAGNPVAGVEIATFWSANGSKGYEEGTSPDLTKPEEMALFWGNIGRMAPFGLAPKASVTDKDGSFRVESRSNVHHVLAMNADRTRGALGIVPVGREGDPITIRLAPLVRVQGRIRGVGTDEKPPWTHVYTLRPEEDARPLDNYRVASCGSFGADFAMLLPPGRYQFHAYDDPKTGEVTPYPELTIRGDEGVIDLGTWHLGRTTEAIVPHMKRVTAEQHLPTLKDRVGQAPPAIAADDARGVPRDWQPGRSSGKWQFIEFWGLGCVPCIGTDIPKLIKFQDDHAAEADRFEIVTVFMDPDGKIRTIADLDAATRSIVANVWGRPLPFPTLIDPSFRTAENWGLGGMGEHVLISPDGKIVAGDLDTLRGILDPK